MEKVCMNFFYNPKDSFLDIEFEFTADELRSIIQTTNDYFCADWEVKSVMSIVDWEFKSTTTNDIALSIKVPMSEPELKFIRTRFKETVDKVVRGMLESYFLAYRKKS